MCLCVLNTYSFFTSLEKYIKQHVLALEFLHFERAFVNLIKNVFASFIRSGVYFVLFLPENYVTRVNPLFPQNDVETWFLTLNTRKLKAKLGFKNNSKK